MFFRPTKGKSTSLAKSFGITTLPLSANVGQKWCQLSLPGDSVRRLTLRPGVRRSPVGQRLAGLAIHQLRRGLKALADLVRATSFFGIWRAFLILSEQ